MSMPVDTAVPRTLPAPVFYPNTDPARLPVDVRIVFDRASLVTPQLVGTLGGVFFGALVTGPYSPIGALVGGYVGFRLGKVYSKKDTSRQEKLMDDLSNFAIP